MSERPPGFLAVPTPIAAALVSAGVLLLPSDARDRYRAEYRAELCTLGWKRQIIEAASLLAGALEMRRALADAGTDGAPAERSPLSCRLGRHRYYPVNDDNPENRRYQHLECGRCGAFRESKDDDFPRNRRLFITGLDGGG